MAASDFLLICITAFAAVFLLLSFLAVVIRLLTAFFPFKEIASDAAVMAAIAAVMQTVYPGAKVTRVEEQK